MEVYRQSGVQEEKLRHVTFGLDPEHYGVPGNRLAGAPGGWEVLRRVDGHRRNRFVFGSVFQWSERKSPRSLIAAYYQAFSEQPDEVLLAIKTYRGHSPKASVQAMVDEITESFAFPTGKPRPPIEIICDHFSRDQMRVFYQNIDCYVSTHRGEGWGLPLHEAALMGKPVVATDWSAPAEYLAECPLYLPVSYTMVSPYGMDEQPYYTVDQKWASPSVEECAVHMESAYMGLDDIRPMLAVGNQLLLFEAERSLTRKRLGSLVDLAGEQALSCLGELL